MKRGAGGGGAERTVRSARCAKSQRVAGREQHVRPHLSEAAFSRADWVAVRVPRDKVAPGSAGQTLGRTTAKVWAGVGRGPGERPGPAAGPAGGRAAGAALPPGGGPGRGASAPDERGDWAGCCCAGGGRLASPTAGSLRAPRLRVGGSLDVAGGWALGLWISRAADGMVGERDAGWARARRLHRARAGRGRRSAWAGSLQGSRGRRALLGRPLLREIRSLRVISVLLQGARAAGLGTPRGDSSRRLQTAHPQASLPWLPHQRGWGCRRG